MKKTVLILMFLVLAVSVAFATDIDVIGSARVGYGSYSYDYYYYPYGTVEDTASLFAMEVGTELYFYKGSWMDLGAEISVGCAFGSNKYGYAEYSYYPTNTFYQPVNLFVGPIAKFYLSDAFSMNLAVGYDACEGGVTTLGIEPSVNYSINEKVGISALARFGIDANFNYYLIGATYKF